MEITAGLYGCKSQPDIYHITKNLFSLQDKEDDRDDTLMEQTLEPDNTSPSVFPLVHETHEERYIIITASTFNSNLFEGARILSSCIHVLAVT